MAPKVYGLRDLIAQTPSEVWTRAEKGKLTPDDLVELERVRDAGSNAHSSAVMGLAVLEDYIEHAVCTAIDAKAATPLDLAELNRVSALLALLREVVDGANDSESTARTLLTGHFKRLAERDAREYVEIPVLQPRKRAAS